MLQIFLFVILFVAGFLFLAIRRWESSVFVQKIDLIPGPEKKPILGNVAALPSESDGKHFMNWFSIKNYVPSKDIDKENQN